MSYVLQPFALAVVSVRIFSAAAYTRDEWNKYKRVVSVRVFRAVAICVHTTELLFCLVFSKNFNIMSALSAHQSPTLSQKIDSRGGLFWCKKG